MFHLFTKIDSISTSELEQKLKEKIQLLDVRTLYVICHSGVRSKMAAKKLKKKGYDVVNVQGGMSAWTGKVV